MIFVDETGNLRDVPCNSKFKRMNHTGRDTPPDPLSSGIHQVWPFSVNGIFHFYTRGGNPAMCVAHSSGLGAFHPVPTLGHASPVQRTSLSDQPSLLQRQVTSAIACRPKHAKTFGRQRVCRIRTSLGWYFITAALHSLKSAAVDAVRADRPALAPRSLAIVKCSSMACPVMAANRLRLWL